MNSISTSKQADYSQNAADLMLPAWPSSITQNATKPYPLSRTFPGHTHTVTQLLTTD